MRGGGRVNRGGSCVWRWVREDKVAASGMRATREAKGKILLRVRGDRTHGGTRAATRHERLHFTKRNVVFALIWKTNNAPCGLSAHRDRRSAVGSQARRWRNSPAACSTAPTAARACFRPLLPFLSRRHPGKTCALRACVVLRASFLPCLLLFLLG